MISQINHALKTGNGDAVIYAGAIGLLLSDIIPTPADGVYFYLEQKNKEKLNNKEITPKQYWRREAFAYYGLNPIWWSLVLGAMVLTKGHYTNKLKVGLAIVGAGAVIGVLNQNIKKDIELEKKS
jgi:hypothetical protein